MLNKLPQFWQELKRRKVIHVIVVYASAAFVIIELVSNTYEPLKLPDWTPTFVIVVLAIGFPFAIIFSWIYDITSKGIVKTGKAIQVDQSSTIANSIAVLPFQDMSQARDQEYFCDGIAEEIINALAHISGLTVIARTSAFSFKNQNLDIREIGQKLNVETLLEGSIRKDVNRLRITVQLVKAKDGSHIWSERFDRNLEDIFAIQEEISLAVVDHLKIKLLGNEKSAILKRYTDDFEVYNLYLKALSNIQLLTSEGFEKAMSYLRQTLQMNPKFVPGFTALGETYVMSTQVGNVPPNKAYPQAKEYAEKALSIDIRYPDAHRIKGLVSLYFDWDKDIAEHHLKYALKLNSNNEWGHFSYSRFLSFMGRNTDAIVEAKRAIELDPLSGLFSANLGYVYTYARRFEQAIHHLQQTKTMFPGFYPGYHYLGIAYQCVSRINEAIKEHRKAVELSGGIPIIITFLALVLYKTGNKEESESLIKGLEKRSVKEYVPAMCFIPYYLLKGDHNQAYNWVERAISEHDSMVFDGFIIPIKEYRIPNEPEYSGLMNNVGLKKFFQIEET